MNEVTITEEQRQQAIRNLKQGWFWQVIFTVKKQAGCSYKAACKFVSELADGIRR